MKIVSLSLTALLVLVVAACGGSDDPTSPPTTTSTATCQGTQLTETQLCQLQCGQTTMAEAEQILGKPDASSGSLIEYTYECAAAGNVIDWDFDFNATGPLTVVTVTGLGSYAGTTVPACLSTCQQ
jgi:hypothetical protein